MIIILSGIAIVLKAEYMKYAHTGYMYMNTVTTV